MYTKSQTTINNILEAARSLFLEKNYADVTINDIVALANVSKGALYHHFSGKEDLYTKMMHHYLSKIQEVVQDSVETATGATRERIRYSIYAFLLLPPEMLGVLRLVRRDINIFKDPVRHDLVRAYQKAVPEHVEKLIRAGVERGDLQDIDPRLLSWQLVALVEVALRPYSTQVLGNLDDTVDFLIGLFLDGIAVRERAGDTTRS
jgi:AcrR family transcriptional regulator